MNTEENGPESIVDQAINEIRNEAIDPAAEEKAAGRVWARLSESAEGPIRTCADFLALMPAWRSGQLPPAKALLLEDHTHECPACRKALWPPKVVAMPARRPGRAVWQWAIAAAVLVSAGLTAWFASDRLLAPTGTRASVQSFSGALYKGETPLAGGAALAEGEGLRTGKGATSMVRLRDGSLVELRERTELTFSEDRRGATLRLAGGSIIVRAAKQGARHLYVATSDCTVAVTGTIFAVSSGLKGSRVSVIEGEVHVAQGNQDQVLHPGDQVSTNATVTPVPLEQEIAWSQNVDQYLAVLKEFSTLRKKLEAMPGPGLRYSSRLLDLAPDTAIFYAAIPNLGPTLTEANRLFQEQLQQSAVLRQWWAQKMKTPADEAKLNDALSRIRAFSDYLGQEIVVTLAPKAAGGQEPLILAEVARSGFRQYLQQEIAKINAEAGHTVVVLVDDPRRAVAADNVLLIYISANNVVAASPDPALLAKAAAGSGFARTPFYARIAASYRDGVSWLFALDLQSMVAAGQVKPGENYAQSGFADARYLVVQHRDVPGGAAENRAVLSFSQPRRGIASWLATPAPMRALDFISPDATFATALLVKNPSLAIEDVFQIFGPGSLHTMSEFEAKTGLNVRADLMQPLGGEVAVAVDGPLLPSPSWKLVLEVTDPARFQRALERLAATMNSEGQPVQLDKEQLSGRTYYRARGANLKYEANWTFDGGFLVAAPSRDLLVRALQYRAVGNSLARAAKFTALLPQDGHLNFSGMVYHSVGALLAPLAGRIQLTPEQKRSLEAVASADGPTLVLLYGEQDRIELASKGAFFGIGLDKLFSGPGPRPARHKGS